MPSLNSRSPAGRVSSVSTRSGCIFWFQRCTWGFASRAVRKFLGTPAFASSPLWRAVGRNIARRSQNGESNQMRFAICDWTPRGCQERFRLGRPVGGPQSRFLASQLFAACSTTCRELLELAILMTEKIAFLLVFSTPYPDPASPPPNSVCTPAGGP